MTTLLDHALAYAERGALIFPLKPSKAPYSDNGMKDGTTDAEQIRQWWAKHPDALIGCRIPEKQVVLDIDPRHGGDTVWRALEESYGEVELGRRHHSGRNDGGFHAWGQHPGHALSTKKLTDWAARNGVATQVRTKAGKLKWTCGIDILHHGHRYTILPPSPHPINGEPYGWDIEGAPLAFPSWLNELIEKPEPVAPPERPRLTLDSDSIADWYTNQARWGDILRDWTIVSGDGEHDGSKWKHPYATAESSATIKHGCLFVYTDNTEFDQTEPDDPHGYTKFRAYAELFHAGDMTVAGRVAREKRDGPRQSPTPDFVPPDAPADEVIDADEEIEADEADDAVDDDWGRYDLLGIAEGILSGEYEPEMPTVLAVADSMPLLYRGRTHSLFGPPGGAKTWVALCAIAERLKAGEHVLMVDWEDAAPGTTRRLVMLGCTLEDISRLDYRAPATSLAFGWAALTASTTPYTLIVMDSTGEALAAQGINPNDDGEVAQWMSMVKKLTKRPGTPAILLLDHVPKASDTPHGAPIGTQRKLAAVTGAAYRVDTLIEPAKGKPGKLKLVVAKDRLGNRAKGSTACEVHMADTSTGITLRFALPEAQAAAQRGEKFRPTHLMERISRFIEDNDGCSKSAVEKDVVGKGATLRMALEVLIDEGWVRTSTEGAGRAIKCHSHLAYREPVDAEDVPPSTPVPPPSLNIGTYPKSDLSTPPSPPSPRIYNEGTGDGGGSGTGDAPQSPTPVPSHKPIVASVHPDLPYADPDAF